MGFTFPASKFFHFKMTQLGNCMIGYPHGCDLDLRAEGTGELEWTVMTRPIHSFGIWNHRFVAYDKQGKPILTVQLNGRYINYTDYLGDYHYPHAVEYLWGSSFTFDKSKWAEIVSVESIDLPDSPGQLP